MVDVLIQTMDRPHKLALTLLGLFQQNTDDFRVIIRDEGVVSAMEDREVRQLWDMVNGKVSTMYLRSKEHKGLVRGRKRLLEFADSKYLLWLDDDIVLPYDGLSLFLAIANKASLFGFINPIILDVDNARNHVDYDYTSVSKEEHEKLGVTKHYRRCDEDVVYKVWRGNGGCMFCRTDKVKKFVKYDFAHITAGEGEDMIASLLLADKLECYFTTSIVVHHLVDATHQWSWTKVAGALVREFLKDKVSKDTLEKSELSTVGIKRI